ncbi:MAG: hypothetical protein NZZ41_02665 [Candidatus Dojkabacteria bacterium]|nr:hypothetical protein [Candidatus Dojkabacteria bacterium]
MSRIYHVIFVDDSNKESVLLESMVYGNSRRSKIIVSGEDDALDVIFSFLERKNTPVLCYSFEKPYIKVYTNKGMKLFYLNPIDDD